MTDFKRKQTVTVIECLFTRLLISSSTLLRSILPFLRASCRLFLRFGLLFSLWRTKRSFRENYNTAEGKTLKTGIQV